MLVCYVLDPLMMRCHFRRQPGASRWTSSRNTLLLLIKSTSLAYAMYCGILMSSRGCCGKLCLKSRRAASWEITKSTGDRLSPCGVPMVVANVEPMPRFNICSNVVSARTIRMIRNSESLTNVSRTVNSLSCLIVSNARLMSIPSTRNDFL